MEQNGVLDACKELGITVLAYSPLGRGELLLFSHSPVFERRLTIASCRRTGFLTGALHHSMSSIFSCSTDVIRRGSLRTGRYKKPEDFGEGDWRSALPRMQKENWEKNYKYVYFVSPHLYYRETDKNDESCRA